MRVIESLTLVMLEMSIGCSLSRRHRDQHRQGPGDPPRESQYSQGALHNRHQIKNNSEIFTLLGENLVSIE